MAKNLKQLLWLSCFSVAMAYLEATVVVYLRQLYYPGNITQVFPLHILANTNLAIELGRELSTIIMLLMVAVIAERIRSRQFAAFVFVFGIWDIFYYVWLKLLIAWPVNWLEWDILFLIPLPWLGPWLAPFLIALLFTLWGGWILMSESVPKFNRNAIFMFILGAILGLGSFLQPTLALLPDGEAAIVEYLPGNFWWWLFFTGLFLMTAGLLQTTRVTPPGQR